MNAVKCLAVITHNWFDLCDTLQIQSKTNSILIKWTSAHYSSGQLYKKRHVWLFVVVKLQIISPWTLLLFQAFLPINGLVRGSVLPPHSVAGRAAVSEPEHCEFWFFFPSLFQWERDSWSVFAQYCLCYLNSACETELSLLHLCVVTRTLLS